MKSCYPGNLFQHDHTAVLGQTSFRFLSVKRALLQRHGLASHWSCTHTGYWSAVRYCVVPTTKKPWATLDKMPVLWDSAGPCKHPPLTHCIREQHTGKASEARRLQAVCAAAEAGKQEPKYNDLDVWALVVRCNIRNSPDNRNAWMELVLPPSLLVWALLHAHVRSMGWSLLLNHGMPVCVYL